MGWLRAYERQNILSLYGRTANYRCDYAECRLPIFIDQLHVEDPKGGYTQVRDNAQSGMFRLKEPKKTYHYNCNLFRLRRKVRGKDDVLDGNLMSQFTISQKAKGLDRRIARTILKILKHRPSIRGYWTVDKIVRQDLGDPKLVRSVIRRMIRKEKIRKVKGHLHLPKVRREES